MMKMSVYSKHLSVVGILTVVLLSANLSGALAKTPEDVLAQLEKQHARLRSFHTVTEKQWTDKRTIQAVTIRRWERHDQGKRLFRVVQTSSPTSGKKKSNDRTTTTVSDGATEWREVPVSGRMMVFKSKPKNSPALGDIRASLKDRRGRIKEPETVLNHRCIVLEVQGSDGGKVYSATYWISEKHGLVLKSTENRNNTTETRTRVTELKINQPIPDAKFTYTPPEGATVVDTEAMRKPAAPKKK